MTKKEYDRARYQLKKEEIKKRTKKYAEEHPEKVREYKHRNAQKHAVKYRSRQKERREKFKEDIKSYQNAYYKENRARLIEEASAYYQKNMAERKEYAKRHRRENGALYRAQAAKKRATKLDATPKWLSADHMKQIKEIYEEADSATTLIGFQIQVDHIIPLKGKDICGLHVPWNLRILPYDLNNSKKNKLPPKEEWLACPA